MLIFYGAKKKYVKNLKFIIYAFELASGLRVSFEKSSIIDIATEDKESSTFARMLGCIESKLPIKYLGLPLHHRKLKASDWNFLVEKVDRKSAS